MRIPTACLSLACTSALLIAAAAPAETVVVDFEEGAAGNIGGWTYGPPSTFPMSGGNPGRYLRVDNLDTFAPQLRTQGQSIFTGDYRDAAVSAIGIDLNTFAVDFSAAGRPLTLMLINDNGTAADTSDDIAAYYMGPNIPVPGEGWKSFSFEIPSASKELPEGWLLFDFSGSGSPALGWNDIITDVDRVLFFYGDPELFFIFQQWDLGADNISITFGAEGIPGDLDGNGVVDGADLGELLANWGGSGPGDLDGNGVVDGADLGELLANWT